MSDPVINLSAGTQGLEWANLCDRERAMPEMFWFAFGTVTGVVFLANVWWLVSITARADQ